jgi:cytochrome c
MHYSAILLKIFLARYHSNSAEANAAELEWHWLSSGVPSQSRKKLHICNEWCRETNPITNDARRGIQIHQVKCSSCHQPTTSRPMATSSVDL